MRQAENVSWTEKDIPNLNGYICIVTGGNSGIGYATAYQLALNGARVYISSRSQDRVDKAIQQMRQEAAGQPMDLRFLQLDLQNLKSVKQSAESFLGMEDRLDILINNAGIMSVPFKLTTDGYESQFQVNYLSPFVFTQILLPLMLSTAEKSGRRKDRVRVVNLSSAWSLMAGPRTMQLNDVNMFNAKGMTVLVQRYAHAKQGSVRHAKELTDRYGAQGVTAYSLHPGIVKSNLQGQDPGFFGKIQSIAMKVQPTVSPLEGALNSLYAATAPEAATRAPGGFFMPVAKIPKDKDGWLADKKGNVALWEWSEAAMAQIR